MDPRLPSKPRILFMAEPATLAHVTRSIVLAGSLDRGRFEVCVATGPDFKEHVEAAGIPTRDLWCIGTQAYLNAVAAGSPVFPYATLERYVEADLGAIDGFKPDVIVGDFRLSLAVSARLARIPYIAISNAYWCPTSGTRRLDLPAHPAVSALGFRTANAIFALIQPLVLALHCLPMHRLCRRHGLPSLGFDLRRVFTEADVTVLADVPEMVPLAPSEGHSRYRFIGPITWSPPNPAPEFLARGDDERPLVYVTLGSSGSTEHLDAIVGALVSLDCRVAVAAKGWRWGKQSDASVHVQDMLPGKEMAAAAALVVCNGGSPGVHQALQEGTPVLGIPANLDQLLNMRFAVATGAALSVRADQVSLSAIQRCASEMLHDRKFRERASNVQQWFGRYNAQQLFRDVIEGVLANPARTARDARKQKDRYPE